MLHRSVEPDESDLLDFHQLWAADENRAAIYRRLSAHPLDRLEGGRCKLLTVPNFFEDSLGEGLLGTGLDGRGDRKNLRFGLARRRPDLDDLGLTHRECTSLVEHDDIKLGGHLEGGRILEQNAVAGSED